MGAAPGVTGALECLGWPGSPTWPPGKHPATHSLGSPGLVAPNPWPFCFSKSQSLTNSLDASQRGAPSEDEAKAETIRNLRKSFASLFSD